MKFVTFCKPSLIFPKERNKASYAFCTPLVTFNPDVPALKDKEVVYLWICRLFNKMCLLWRMWW